MANLYSKFNQIRSHIISFVREEPLTVAILLFCFISYAAFFMLHPSEPKEPSKAMQDIKVVEEKLKEQDQVELLLNFFQESEPIQVFFFILFPLMLFGATCIGVALNVYALNQWSQKKEVIPKGYEKAPPIGWGIREIIKCVIFIVFMSLALALLVVVLNIFFDTKTHYNFVILMHTLMIDVSVLFFIYYLTKTKGCDLTSLGLKFQKLKKDLFAGLAIYAAVLPIIILVLTGLVFISELISYEPPPHPLVEILVEEDKKTPIIIYLSIFLACTLGPVIEEMFFRGFCYPVFKEKWGSVWGMVISAAFFASIHGSLFAFIPIFVLGLILAYVYEKRNSLIPSIVIHVTHNSIFIGYFFLLKRNFIDPLMGG